MSVSKPRVYMAGKITGPRASWRRGLAVYDGRKEWMREMGMFVYVGPWSMDTCQGMEDRDVVEMCRRQIVAADLLLVRIDDLDVHGTFAEIGMAVALGKRILLDMDPALVHATWFIVQLVLKHPPTLHDFVAVDAFVTFLPYAMRNPTGYIEFYGLLALRA